MNITDITIGQAREIEALLNQPTTNSATAHPWTIGGLYFIRTVTHHYTGKLVAVYPQELVLTDAAWIADDGRFADAVKTGNFNEVEPFPDGAQVNIGRAAILDAVIINKIPRSQK